FFAIHRINAEDVKAEEKPFEHVLEAKGEALVTEGDFTVDVTNLVGTVTVENSSENKVEWLVCTHSIAKDEKRAQELAEKVKIKAEFDETSKTVCLKANYPVSEHFIYYYPATAKDASKKK